MTDYPQYPAGATPEPPPGQGPRGPRPQSIVMAVNLIWVGVAITVISAIVAFVGIDDSVDAALESDTSGTLTEDAARTAIIGFSIVILLIGVGLYTLIAVFLNKGKNWARILYTVLGVVFLLLNLIGLTGEQSGASTVVALISILLIVATMYFLWKKESTAWLTGRPAVG